MGHDLWNVHALTEENGLDGKELQSVAGMGTRLRYHGGLASVLECSGSELQRLVAFHGRGERKSNQKRKQQWKHQRKHLQAQGLRLGMAKGPMEEHGMKNDEMHPS